MRIRRYRVLLNLNCDTSLQVPKDVTAAEIEVLRAVHGGRDAVVRGYRLDAVDVDPQAEYERLLAEYGSKALASAGITPDKACLARAKGLKIVHGDVDESGEEADEPMALPPKASLDRALADAFDEAAS